MKREIKFRAKSTETGRWVYGYYSPVAVPILGVLGHCINEGGYKAIDIAIETLGQLLHREKDGTEWYEGDICRAEFCVHVSGHPVYGDDEYFQGYRVGEVVFGKRHGAAYRNGYVHDDNEGTFKVSKSVNSITFSRSSVIGNIYDNPELLNIPEA